MPKSEKLPAGHAVQALETPVPAREYEPAGHAEQAVEFAAAQVPAVQFVHAIVCEPAAEQVPAAQLATIASAVEVQGVVTRWPAPAVEQAEHVGLGPVVDAKKAPLVHTHAVKSVVCSELALQFMQLAAACAEKVFPEHCVQTAVWPAVLYVPAAQAGQLSAPGAEEI